MEIFAFLGYIFWGVGLNDSVLTIANFFVLFCCSNMANYFKISQKPPVATIWLFVIFFM